MNQVQRRIVNGDLPVRDKRDSVKTCIRFVPPEQRRAVVEAVLVELAEEERREALLQKLEDVPLDVLEGMVSTIP
jgi:hypothetical protein